MISQIEIELTTLRNSLIELCNLVLVQVDKAGNALNTADIDLANEVMRYEKRINGLEVNIEKACENILALYNPVAHDLRFVLSTLKINLNLERIGDYARSIAKITKIKETAFNKSIIEKLEINKMFQTTHLMLLTILETMENDEDDKLRTLFVKDEILNEIQDNAINVIVKHITANPSDLTECMNLYVVVRKMERVGDHIKNIAEEIIFYKEAKILRHKGKKAKKDLRGGTGESIS
ncbi:MAG: phosphate signaling complex protein PhoU [Chloroflexota bacterium]